MQNFENMIPEYNPKHFKYMRIQGRELASNTHIGKGIFSMCWTMIQNSQMSEEDAELYRALDSWIAEILPYPEQCLKQESCVCFFKTENADELSRLVIPILWLLDKYHHPYYVIFTNYLDEIIYEDEYQVVVKADSHLIVEEQASWTGTVFPRTE